MICLALLGRRRGVRSSDSGAGGSAKHQRAPSAETGTRSKSKTKTHPQRTICASAAKKGQEIAKRVRLGYAGVVLSIMGS